MNAFDQGKLNRARFLRLAVAGAMLCAVVVASTVGYATDGFTHWPWTVRVGDDGKVRDANGNVVGKTIDNQDGSTTIMIQTSPTTGLMGESTQPIKNEDIQIGAKPFPSNQP